MYVVIVSFCFVMSGLIGTVSEVYPGDRVETVRGPAANKIEREIDLAKEILESEILVSLPPKKKDRCVIKTQNQKGGRVGSTKKITKKQPTNKRPTSSTKKPVIKRKRKNV